LTHHLERKCGKREWVAAIPTPIFSSDEGAALLRTLYDDQGLRTLCDVDLLVDERDVERADTHLQA